MNATDIQDRIYQLTKRARVFGHSIGGATAMCWDGQWSVMVDMPKIHSRCDTIEEAFRDFEEQLSRHEIAQANLGKTLGLDAAE